MISTTLVSTDPLTKPVLPPISHHGSDGSGERVGVSHGKLRATSTVLGAWDVTEPLSHVTRG